MNLLTLREGLGGHERHDDSAAATKNMAKLLGAHRRVLLVLDRTDDLDTALPAFVAGAHGAARDVVVLVVLPEWSTSRLEARTKAHLKRIAGEVTSPTIRVSAELALGEPVATVLETAARCRADLIAMTVHHVGIFERLLDHSLLEEVLRRSPVPVVAVTAAGKAC